ncbi:protein-tyrosine phosphatase-like protein [Gigaspora rosea]|uniref:Protein-tyrosine phosphatase-like protein n=1 Tax=Gigaspora rosea TaxID=44941 RepID=A0A397VF05_9GLOM|nr:protein-tyrosine phosphatase-like protein [Gigaspora rosea]
MDFLKITKVENVTFEKGQIKTIGTLHLTTHQIIFRHADRKGELWIPYPIIHTVERRLCTTDSKLWPLTIRCRDFKTYSFFIQLEQDSTDVFDTIQKLTCIESISQVYAFDYKPEKEFSSSDGWSIYNVFQEYGRMGVGIPTSSWRFSSVNQDYTFCETYPHTLVVPAKISDNVLNHASKFRSKNRIPVLSYLHWQNKASITRSSQPMVGLKKNRSIQDEKLIEAIFQSNDPTLPPGLQSVFGSTQTNLIVDARPTANAIANAAIGAGTENMENYKNCDRKFMGIDNIHVMRESLAKLVEVMQTADAQCLPIKKQNLDRSNWLKHIASLLESSLIIIKNVHIASSHVLIHCSDGWDRTAQLTSISILCLDPYYRTFRGFQVLVEKEWVSFGHKFTERSGHLSDEKYFINSVNTNAANTAFNTVQSKFYNQPHVREISPVFQQFLDCVFQLLTQFPTRFEFNEKFLIELHYHCYSCQFGTFLCNSEKERMDYNVTAETYSVWDYFNSNKSEFLNPLFDGGAEDKEDMGNNGVLLPDEKNIKYWAGLFNKKDEELNNNNNNDETEGFTARIRWKSDSPISRTNSPGISDADTLKEGLQTISFKPVNYDDNPDIDPWKNK